MYDQGSRLFPFFSCESLYLPRTAIVTYASKTQPKVNFLFRLHAPSSQSLTWVLFLKIALKITEFIQ
jgi:hypothetical protein